MSNVAVDIGNTRIKSALFDGERKSATTTHADLHDLLNHYGNHNHSWIFSSVSRLSDNLEIVFDRENYVVLNRNMKLPIQLNYKTPETLGVDRIAAAVGANELFSGRNVLVIDMGTCITYDVVDEHEVYQGGVIAPGLTMRMKAMAHFTKALPDISEEFSQISLETIGKSTKECLLAGSLSATIHEMNGFVEDFRKEYDNLKVVITGGDAFQVESKLVQEHVVNMDLVLVGLNRIMGFNEFGMSGF